MNFCSRCGAPVALRVPPGDDRPRHVCDACGTVHYQNPKLVAGCLVEWGDQVLLCRRAIQPRYGLWTLPAGFMENGETTREAAQREALEEANARVELLELYSLFDLPHIDQVYCLFRGRLLDLDFSPGSESLEVRLFREEEIPWQALAFASIARTLQLYYEDRSTGRYRLHTGTIPPPRPV
ncbi:MAG: NUDIX hydrolase [Gammaproteobacteria bacterium]|nr:NUDIX hydrolase [Gammaproteobacteria bacterium]